MKHRALVLFDFDGTLYPIAPYDSEQLLVRSVASHKSTLFKQRANRFIAQDQAGKFTQQGFSTRYAHLVQSANQSMIDAIAHTLATRLNDQDIAALSALHNHADLAILSCGTQNIIEAFLAELGLRDLFIKVKAKRLVWDEKGTAQLTIDIASAEDKALNVETFRPYHFPIVAIGDGPTDIPMLKASDHGILVNWNSGKNTLPFETHCTLKKAVLAASSYIVNAQ